MRVSVLFLLFAVVVGSARIATSQEIDDAAIARAIRELERVRGEKLGDPPPIQRLRRDEFRDLVTGQIHNALGGPKEVARLENVLRGLDLLDRKDTLVALAMRFLPSSVGAQYDPYQKRIRVLGRVRGSTSLLVHELTHALDDRRFDFRKHIHSGDLDFDRLLAIGALAEGSAESVQQTFDTDGGVLLVPLSLIRNEGEKRIEAYLARRKQFPRFLARSFIFQYFKGFLFVQTEMRRGEGWASLDAVFRAPPETTEQILHPEKYRAREGAKPVRDVAVDGWNVTGDNRLGELGTAVVMESWGQPWWAAAASAQGWGGDRVTTFERDGHHAMIWRTTWDHRPAANRMHNAFRHIGLRRGRVFEAGGVVFSEHADGYDLLYRRGLEVTLARGVPKAALHEFLVAVRR